MKPDLNDNRGAVMVMAVFVAMLLTGLVYHVAGIGGATLEQQIMQDAADASVFSAATVNARGMNIIALINMIMAALLTILVALRLVQALLTIALVASTVCCAIPFSALICCELVGAFEGLKVGVEEAANAYEEVAKPIIKALHQASDVVKTIVPPIAMAEGANITMNKPYSPPANVGIVFPVFEDLPVKPGTYGELCKKAGENIMIPISYIFGKDGGEAHEFFEEKVGGLMGELTETFSGFFCGDDGGGNTPDRPAPEAFNRDVGYPPGYDDNPNHENGMAHCVNDSASAHPDPDEGKCHTDICKDCAKRGCDFCFGALKNNSNYQKGLWTTVTNHWVEWIGSDEFGVSRLVRTPAEPRVIDKWQMRDDIEGNPCSGDSNTNLLKYDDENCTGYDDIWGYGSLDSYESDDVPMKGQYRPVPICELLDEAEIEDEIDIKYYLERHQKGSKDIGPGVAFPRMTLKKQTLYVGLSGCIIKKQITVTAEGDSIISGEGDKESMSPFVLDEDKYKDQSKMTGIVEGSPKRDHREKGVAIGWKEANRKNNVNMRFSFASAEYYSQSKTKDVMWEMRWLSRLIRFRLGDDGDNAQGSGDMMTNNKGGFDMMEQAKEQISKELGAGMDIDDYLLH